ncbi:MAG: ABC transporter ATP-binding protein [Hyphomicrobiaceae bacterium]
MSEPLVVLDRVVKRFGDFIAVHEMDLGIGQGEFLAIMGPSGCGKTTTLRMLAGLEQPSDGDIRLDGKSIKNVPPHLRDTPMVWQSLALFPFLNARENVEFGLKMRGVGAEERKTRALDWISRLELSEFAERGVDTLSGGQRQRVALARALVTQPRILLLDEPLSALDASLKVRMQALMVKLQREIGITFVYVTHSHAEAFSMADRVVIMSRGRIEQIGTPVEVYRRPASRFVAEFVGASNILEGAVVGQEADGAIVDTSLGRFLLGGAKELAVGEAVTFVVPEDHVYLASAKPEARNKMTAKVIGEEFLGAAVRLYVELADGREARLLATQDGDATLHRPGDAIELAWDAGSAFVLPKTG